MVIPPRSELLHPCELESTRNAGLGLVEHNNQPTLGDSLKMKMLVDSLVEEVPVVLVKFSPQPQKIH